MHLRYLSSACAHTDRDIQPLGKIRTTDGATHGAGHPDSILCGVWGDLFVEEDTRGE